MSQGLPDHGLRERMMHRCIELAKNGMPGAAPNPMVGAVLATRDQVLAEGWHMKRGGPHAEVNCLRSFGDGPVPAEATLYVNLEPCAHIGATPPCVDLLIARGVRHLVVGNVDPDTRTNGQGIARARASGMDVVTNVLDDECRWLNRRFITSLKKHRPFVVLKWATSKDGFIDNGPTRARSVHRISSPTTDVLVHQWRTEEQAILVGSRTVLHDDPSLNVRHVGGRSPLRVVIDRAGIVPSGSRMFVDGAALLITAQRREDLTCEQVIVDAAGDPITATMDVLHERNIRSVLVEGGAELHQRFIDRGLWDEARIVTSPLIIGRGTKAPRFLHAPQSTTTSGTDTIDWHVADPHGGELR